MFGVGYLLRAVIALLGVVITTTQKRKKRVLSPLRQRTNDTTNTFGLRAPEKGTHWHRKGQPALICQTWAWLLHWPPQPTLGNVTPASAIPALVQALLDTDTASQTLLGGADKGSPAPDMRPINGYIQLVPTARCFEPDTEFF